MVLDGLLLVVQSHVFSTSKATLHDYLLTIHICLEKPIQKDISVREPSALKLI
jgi:hypothetical protein